MHAITILHADLSRAKDIARLEAASHARRVRECRGHGSRLGRMGWWPVLATALLLVLALGTGTVTVSQAESAGARADVGRVAPGSVIAGEAAGSGVSVSTLLEAAGPEAIPMKAMGAPGKVGTRTIPVPNP
jgi:hypothetical protein